MSELEHGLALNKSISTGNHMMTCTAQHHGHGQVSGRSTSTWDGEPRRLRSYLEALHHNLGGSVWLTWRCPQGQPTQHVMHDPLVTDVLLLKARTDDYVPIYLLLLIE